MFVYIGQGKKLLTNWEVVEHELIFSIQTAGDGFIYERWNTVDDNIRFEIFVKIYSNEWDVFKKINEKNKQFNTEKKEEESNYNRLQF